MAATLILSSEKAKYLSLVSYSRRFTPEDVFFRGEEFPDIDSAAIALVEAGETAWGTPEFERSMFDLFKDWAGDGRLIRCSFYSRWLMETAPDSCREWLQDFLNGNFSPYFDDWRLANHILGTPEQYLYPLRLNHLIAAQHRRDLRHTSSQSQQLPHPS